MLTPAETARFTWPAAACVSLYGLGSWIVINGLWVELPVLVNILPEGWDLPAYLSVLIQIANIGPLVYVPLTKLSRNVGRGFCAQCVQPPERLANCVILTIGLLACIFLANFWKCVITTPIGAHSIALLALALCAAVVDCTTSVTFNAYLSGMPETYMGALAFGEAFSDLVPSVVALIQGVGSDPTCVNHTINGTTVIIPVYPPARFSVSVFMYFLALIMAVSLTAFIALDRLPWGLGSAIRQHYLATRKFVSTAEIQVESVRSAVEKVDGSNSRDCTPTESPEAVVVMTSHKARPRGIRMCTSEFLLPISLICYSSFLTNGFLPGFQSYSTAAYSSLVYHLSVTISGIFCALVTVVVTYYIHQIRTKQFASRLQHFVLAQDPEFAEPVDQTDWATKEYVRRSQVYWILTAVLATVPAAYVVYLASASPNPPNLNGVGRALAVIAWVLLKSGFTFLRTWLWLHLSSRSHEPMALRYAGLSTQAGAAVGALLNFLLIVHFRLFHPKPSC